MDSSSDTLQADTLQKALRINLDPRWYGTIAEIGAGQEVARWLFRAGAAAGTVATRNRSPSPVVKVRTEDSERPSLTSCSGPPRGRSMLSRVAGPLRVRKTIRTSAAPSIHDGAPWAATSDRVVKEAALCARSSSESSSESCSCWRITTNAVSAMIAIDAPRVSAVSTATREASERR